MVAFIFFTSSKKSSPTTAMSTTEDIHSDHLENDDGDNEVRYTSTSGL
jgi:hypothetical protein